MNEERSKTEKNWVMLSHLSALAVFLGMPFGNIIGPLVVWLLKRDEYESVDRQGKESLNFQISVTVYFIVSAILSIIAVGFVLMAAIAVFTLVMVISASIKAGEGEDYIYPLTIRFIS